MNWEKTALEVSAKVLEELFKEHEKPLLERIKQLESNVQVLESLRPHWAMGYSSDSMAAQTATIALSSVWGVLGARNQTEAMLKLREFVHQPPQTQKD